MLNRAGKLDTGAAIGIVAVGAAGLGLGLLLGGGGFGGRCDGQLSASMSEVLDPIAYPWTRFQEDVSKAGDLDVKAQHDHMLKDKDGKDATTADIYRINSKSGSRKASCFDDKVVVVGLIYPRADFQDLYLKGSDNNYFVVYRNTKEPAATQWHGAILNDTSRKAITFSYKSHPKKDDDSNPPDHLTDPYKNCWTNQQRACFGELPPKTPPPPPAPGLGFGLGVMPLQGGGGSEPWISCAQFGCCCGGTGCHTDM